MSHEVYILYNIQGNQTVIKTYTDQKKFLRKIKWFYYKEIREQVGIIYPQTYHRISQVQTRSTKYGALITSDGMRIAKNS